MSAYYYKVYINTFSLNLADGFEHGHAFIEIGGPGLEPKIVGYYPNNQDPNATGISWPATILEAQGLVLDDTHYVPKANWQSESVEISESQFHAMSDYVDEIAANPGIWGVAWNNCAGFVYDTLKAGGVSLPTRLHPVPHPNVFNPYSLSNPTSADQNWSEHYGFAPHITFNALFDAAAKAPKADPLTLDLDGDGIETSGINTAAPVMFDISGSGLQQSVGWVGADDGFLVRDLNSNGLIDSGTELFGDATTLANGTKATDGFAALADLDSNHDGVVNASDAAFSQLRVWRDLDHDGVTDAGELQTLASLGVANNNYWRNTA